MKKIILTFVGFILFGLVVKAQTIHTVGENFGGGIVFDVSVDSLHGLIAYEEDLYKFTWTIITKPAFIPSKTPSDFYGWRAPNKEELMKLFNMKETVGGFKDCYYWSSTDGGNNNGWVQDFENGRQYLCNKELPLYTRPIRTF